MPGRARIRGEDGTLLCTKGQHMVPVTEFAEHSYGTIDSWCKTCRRTYNTDYQRKKRKAEKELALRLAAAE